MSNADDDGASAPRGFWQSLTSFVSRQLSGITLIGVLGLLTTLIVAYFQNLSAYHDKVTTQAKDDPAVRRAGFRSPTPLPSIGIVPSITSWPCNIALISPIGI